jgi:hypothetical protein
MIKEHGWSEDASYTTGRLVCVVYHFAYWIAIALRLLMALALRRMCRSVQEHRKCFCSSIFGFQETTSDTAQRDDKGQLSRALSRSVGDLQKVEEYAWRRYVPK